MKVSYRNQLATQLAGEEASVIARRYVYLSEGEMAEMVDLVERHLMERPFSGVGIELGSGCASLAAAVATRPQVRAVLGLEICENFDILMNKVARSVLGSEASKIIPVVGSFDDLRIPDDSLDFAVDHDSLHHSDDLETTIKECARVLKPGGVLVCFDRCHPNSVTDEDVERMLNHVYSPRFLKANGYPTDIRLTRGENGEHEYRLFEWQAATEAAGMELTRHCEMIPRVRSHKALKGALSLLPAAIRSKLYRTDNADLGTTVKWIGQGVQSVVGRAADTILGPKKSSLLVMTKRA
jgi:ubiquinone/menaquinone biosynthesis C-methylase UbiE